MVDKFRVDRSTRCSVSPGLSAHVAEEAAEGAGVWCQTLPCTCTLPGRELPCGHVPAAGTAKCLLESSHQAPRSVGACTGSKRRVYFCNSVGQIIPLRIPLLVGFPGVYFFSLSSSLRFIRTVFVTDTGTDARMSYQEMSRSFHFGTAVFM